MTGLLDLAIACQVDFGLSAVEQIVRRHITDDAVQANDQKMNFSAN